MLASIAGLNAQYTLYNVYHVESMAHSSTNTNNAIVRSNDIVYFEDQEQGYFAYHNSLGGVYYEVKLPKGWSVWDFRVLGKTAYFCGRDRNTNRALLGDFDIGNLLSGSGIITYNYDMNIGSYFAVLTRLAAAFDGENVSIMAIGQTSSSIDPNRYGADKVLYFEDYSSSMGLLYDCSGEVFWDVAATENNFAIVGTASNIPCSTLYLHSVLFGATSVNLSNRYMYSCARNFVSGIRAEALRNDSIALASYYRCNDPYEPSGLQVFSVHSIGGQMSHHQYHYYPLDPTMPTVPTPKEMAFLPDSCFLMVTDTLQYPDGVSLLRLYAYPAYTPYSYCYGAPLFHPDDTLVHYTSLALLSPTSNYCIAVSGASWTSFNMSTIVNPYYLYIDGCHTPTMVDMFKDSNYSPSPLPDGNESPYNKEIKQTPSIRPSMIGINMQCSRNEKQDN